MDERITTAGVAIVDNRVFVARRKEGGPLSLKWEFPGGKNRYSESVEDTLKREWQEELELDIDVGPLLTEVEFENNGTLYHLKCHCVYPKSFDFILHEHTETMFATKEELLSLSFGPSDHEIAEYILRSGLI